MPVISPAADFTQPGLPTFVPIEKTDDDDTDGHPERLIVLVPVLSSAMITLGVLVYRVPA